MKRVRCVDNSAYPASLTVGKIYSVLRENSHCYAIIDDMRDGTYLFEKQRFVVVEE